MSEVKNVPVFEGNIDELIEYIKILKSSIDVEKELPKTFIVSEQTLKSFFDVVIRHKDYDVELGTVSYVVFIYEGARFNLVGVNHHSPVFD